MSKTKMKKTLLRLLREMPADKITVDQFCEEADISRQTLYNNYYGIVAVMEELVSDMMKEAAGEYKSTIDWAAQIKAVMQMFTDNSAAIMHLYNSKYREDFLAVINTHVEPLLRHYVENCAAEQNIELDSFDKRIIVAFFMDIYAGVTRRFIRNNLADDPEYVVSRYAALLRGQATEAVKKFDALRKVDAAISEGA